MKKVGAAPAGGGGSSDFDNVEYAPAKMKLMEMGSMGEGRGLRANRQTLPAMNSPSPVKKGGGDNIVRNILQKQRRLSQGAGASQHQLAMARTPIKPVTDRRGYVPGGFANG